MQMHSVFRGFFALLILGCVSEMATAGQPLVDFDRDIRPILSNYCYTCHGPDENQRQTSLRLDMESSAKGVLEAGGHAVVPGNSRESELIARITSQDPDLRMPPADSEKQLDNEQIELLRRWIDEGAQWRGHWAFMAPKRPDLPEVADASWPRNPIDHFILHKLASRNLRPSPEADKVKLIRRVTFDLTGLPPTPEEVDEFLADTQPQAYERLVDRLLRSPRYGEHRTRFWLDAARYGDTHGLHLDNVRSLWPYRDWVIKAFNSNMPFDQFTIEQLAGDLLPNPSLEQLIATGFNRCNVTTSEGGSISEEYRVRYAVDRVETTATVWMGLTAGCAACHDHKFDPMSQREFYQLFAYFGNLDENPMDGNALLPPPVTQVPTPEQAKEKDELQTQLAAIRSEIQLAVAKVEYSAPQDEGTQPVTPQDYVWIDDSLPAGATPQASGTGPTSWQFVGQPEHPVFCGEKSMLRTATGLSQHFFTGAEPPLTVGKGDRFFCYVYLDPQNPPKEIMLQFNDGTWEHRAIWGENQIDWGQLGTPSRKRVGDLPANGEWVRLEVPAEEVGLKPGSKINGWAFTQFDGTVIWDKAGLVTMTPQAGAHFDSLAVWEAVQKSSDFAGLPGNIQEGLKVEPDKRSDEQKKAITSYFVEHAYSKSRPIFEPLHQKLAATQKSLDDLNGQIPGTMIMRDRTEPRETFVLTRGEYDKPDTNQKVEMGVPAFLPPLPSDAPKNRLALAQWLISPEHPLTARVTVNRFWQQYFGTGLVKTSEDFGAQGERPSHPELLDWLAVEFRESGWDVKHIQRLIVTSATYRQDSSVTPELHRIDPENRLLARGPRFRLDAEMVRDQALAVSGLLVEQIGGPSVKPYQPPGLWEAVGYTDSNTAKFNRDDGAALFRRSMYTFWKRTSPPPSMATFDAPSRESCTVRRARTNTPLQALALMNDVQFVEASRKFAERIIHHGGTDLEQRLEYAFRLVTSRRPDEKERKLIADLYRGFLEDYRGDKEAAVLLISVGEAPRDESLDPAEHAAWTMIGNLLLNLDETITKG